MTDFLKIIQEAIVPYILEYEYDITIGFDSKINAIAIRFYDRKNNKAIDHNFSLFELYKLKVDKKEYITKILNLKFIEINSSEKQINFIKAKKWK